MRWTGLAPFVQRGRARSSHRACELCGAGLAAEHAHLADVEQRALACACAACALLFSSQGAGGGRWRAVPRRYVRDPAFVCTEGEWESLAIPVGMAFFVRSAEGAWTAIYPSPAGPVESLLRLEAWQPLSARTALARLVEPDVEALLFAPRGTGDHACLLVPVDACYALVGRVRTTWRGFDGGEEAKAVVAAHLGSLEERCESVGGEPS